MVVHRLARATVYCRPRKVRLLWRMTPPLSFRLPPLTSTMAPWKVQQVTKRRVYIRKYVYENVSERGSVGMTGGRVPTGNTFWTCTHLRYSPAKDALVIGTRMRHILLRVDPRLRLSLPPSHGAGKALAAPSSHPRGHRSPRPGVTITAHVMWESCSSTPVKFKKVLEYADLVRNTPSKMCARNFLKRSSFARDWKSTPRRPRDT